MIATLHSKLTGIKKLHLLVAGVMVISFVTSVLSVYNANAAAALQTMVRFDTIKQNTNSTGTVCFRPATTSADVKTWTVTFPTGYNVTTTAANWQTTNISTTNTGWPSGAVAWPNATSATAAASGQTVTWTNASAQTMNNTSTYCYNWTLATAITTHTSAGSSWSGTVATQNSSATQIDSGSYAATTIATDNHIAVSATVAPTFSYSLNGTTDAFPTLTGPTVQTGGNQRTLTINTNASAGWQVWAKSTQTNGGLRSTTASHTIPSTCSSGTGTNTTLTSAAEGYNTGVALTIGTGSGSVATVFDRAATAYRGGGLCGTYQTLATGTTEATNAQLAIYNNVAVVGATPAATDYADTITITAAGLF